MTGSWPVPKILHGSSSQFRNRAGSDSWMHLPVRFLRKPGMGYRKPWYGVPYFRCRPRVCVFSPQHGAGTFRHQPFGRQKFLPISATIMSPKCPIKYVHKPLVPKRQERSEAERRAIWPCLNVATWRRERNDRAIQQI